jgi:phosphopantothenate-cysteine ligase
VIGNDLSRRKWEVVFVERRPSSETTTMAAAAVAVDDPDGLLFTETWLRISPASPLMGGGGGNSSGAIKEIEEDIVEELVRRHRVWIESGGCEV